MTSNALKLKVINGRNSSVETHILRHRIESWYKLRPLHSHSGSRHGCLLPGVPGFLLVSHRLPRLPPFAFDKSDWAAPTDRFIHDAYCKIINLLGIMPHGKKQSHRISAWSFDKLPIAEVHLRTILRTWFLRCLRIDSIGAKNHLSPKSFFLQ